MSRISPKIVFVKLSIIAALLAVFCFLSFSGDHQKVNASASGPTASHTDAPGESNCTACHTSFPVNSGTGGVLIAGVPANYLPNQQIPVTVTTSQSDAVIYGFQLTALDSQGRQAGTFTLPDQSPQQLQIVDGLAGGFARKYVEHNINGILPVQFGSKSWTFIWNAPAERVGKIGFYAAGNAANSDGGTSGDYIYSTSKSTRAGTAVSDFDGDGRSDIAVWRPSNGVWYRLDSTNGNFNAAAFGAGEDKITAGDYDGDGITDLAVFRPSNGTWYVQRSRDGFAAFAFGASGDIPVPADYDGDLKTDYAVFRPSNGVWYIFRSSDGGFDSKLFGFGTDKPVQGDYDGDGKTDIAVFRPSNGVWYLQKSRDGFAAMAFGETTDKPVQGDYDGDGKTDIAVYRPSNGVWYLQKSRDGFAAAAFGASTDQPVPADYDGDGKTDIAVFRSGTWYVLKSADGSSYGIAFGAGDDIPVPGGYIPN